MSVIESDAPLPVPGSAAVAKPAGADALRRRAVDRGEALDTPVPDRIGGSPEVTHRDRIFRRSLIFADAAAIAACLPVALGLAGHLGLQPTAIFAVPAVVVLSKLLGLYDREELVLRKSTLEETPQLVQLATILLLLVWFGGDMLTVLPLTRTVGALLWVELILFMLATRSVARAWARVVAPVERLLLVGDATQYQRFVEKLESDPSARAGVVAHLPLVERRSLRAEQQPWEALDWAVSLYNVHRVIVAPGEADSETTVNVISRAKSLGVNVTIMPRIAEVIGSSVTFDQLGGIPMLGVRRFGLTRSSRAVKRAVDLAGAAVGLALGGPLMAAIALLVRLDTPGPALYRQLRVGRDGRHFTMLKFRSMVDGADAQRMALARQGDAGGLFKLADDPRVTRIGRFLRRTSLDELPQLWNVLRGEMSLVGPRPLVIEEDQRVAGWHRRRLHLTPGMTGPWQVMGSATVRVPLQDMVTIDYLYVANWSLWVDIKILARTISHVVSRRGV
jgi:exopolysaccharide biosynthesis polyprenyl glycosylphosphotransferase